MISRVVWCVVHFFLLVYKCTQCQPQRIRKTNLCYTEPNGECGSMDRVFRAGKPDQKGKLAQQQTIHSVYRSRQANYTHTHTHAHGHAHSIHVFLSALPRFVERKISLLIASF